MFECCLAVLNVKLRKFLSGRARIGSGSHTSLIFQANITFLDMQKKSTFKLRQYVRHSYFFRVQMKKDWRKVTNVI